MTITDWLVQTTYSLSICLRMILSLSRLHYLHGRSTLLLFFSVTQLIAVRVMYLAASYHVLLLRSFLLKSHSASRSIDPIVAYSRERAGWTVANLLSAGCCECTSECTVQYLDINNLNCTHSAILRNRTQNGDLFRINFCAVPCTERKGKYWAWGAQNSTLSNSDRPLGLDLYSLNFPLRSKERMNPFLYPKFTWTCAVVKGYQIASATRYRKKTKVYCL